MRMSSIGSMSGSGGDVSINRRLCQQVVCSLLGLSEVSMCGVSAGLVVLWGPERHWPVRAVTTRELVIANGLSPPV